MVIAILTYKKSIEEIDKFLQKHRMFLEKYYEAKKIIFSGRRNPRIGGVILFNMDSLEDVKEIIKEDPFYYNELADYEIIEFAPTKWDDDFNKFML